jgi:carboxyl-terminal processing protease
VGTKTAGAVVAGSISPIDEKCTAYIAVLDGTIGGVRLEGVGVTPDVEIENKSLDQSGYERQLEVARETLMEMLKPSR